MTNPPICTKGARVLQKDVAAIYQGKKSLPEVTPPKLKVVRDRLAQVEAENVAKWGRFLPTG
jgi:hypothetical protein